MKIMSFEELLKKYKDRLDNLIEDDPIDVNYTMMFRSSIINILDSLTERELRDFLKVDYIFIGKSEDITKASPGLQDFINDKTALIYKRLANDRLVA